MKTFRKVVKSEVDDIVCDICNKSCKGRCDIECATLAATWGYDSRKDGEIHTCDLCEDCYEKIRQFIESLGGTVHVENIFSS